MKARNATHNYKQAAVTAVDTLIEGLLQLGDLDARGQRHARDIIERVAITTAEITVERPALPDMHEHRRFRLNLCHVDVLLQVLASLLDEEGEPNDYPALCEKWDPVTKDDPSRQPDGKVEEA